MTFNIVNFATISVTDKELQALREASQFIQKVQQALELRHTDRIIRADTSELIELDELRRIRGILDAFNESKTYWNQYTDVEEE
jgi:hypothetical protein